MGVLNQFGQPVSTSRVTSQASRNAGAYRGSIAEWYGPQVHSPEAEKRERNVMQRRAADLSANDWAAHSAVEAIASNAVGTGLVPKSSIPAKMLGITPELAREIGEQLEWCFALWTTEADVRGLCHFADMQNLGIRTMLSLGEMLHLVVMLPETERMAQTRTFSLALQALSPLRLMTPADLQLDPLLRDGVRLSEYGRPEAYYLATPKATVADALVSLDSNTLFSERDFTCIPARVGHRRGLFHLFRHETDEQVRGVSAFSKGIALFRNLSDAISYELFAQVIAASFPVFMAQEDGGLQLPAEVREAYGQGDEEEKRYIQRINPGQILYGNRGEKPIPLESKRPSANFTSFVDIVLRATAASTHPSHEVFKFFGRKQAGANRRNPASQYPQRVDVPAQLQTHKPFRRDGLTTIGIGKTGFQHAEHFSSGFLGGHVQ